MKDTHHTLEAVRAKIISAVPEIVELKFGCEVRIPTPKRYAEYMEEELTPGIVLLSGENRGLEDTEVFLHVWLNDMMITLSRCTATPLARPPATYVHTTNRRGCGADSVP